MIQGRIPLPRPARGRTDGDRPFRDRSFLLRFVAAVGLGITACTALFLLPATYFIEQNYDVFLNLAYDVRPGLVGHLEREILWLRFFLIAGGLCTLAVSLFLTWRHLQRLQVPLDQVDDHLRSMTGGDWSGAAPAIPSSDVNRDFFVTYEMFHRSLRFNAEADLMLLEKLVIDPAHREAYGVWKTLVATQRVRLGLPGERAVSDSSAEFSAAAPSRRAS